jgi:transcriptional regulator with XRE-family HTH domain
MTGEQTFGGAIAARRKELRLSQKELSAQIIKEDGTPITPQYLNDIEHDRRSPTSEHLVAELERVLDLPPDYLFVLAGKMPLNDVRRASAAGPEQVSKAMLAFRRALAGKGGKN